MYSYYFKNGARLFLANSITTLISVGVLYILANFITKDLHGEYRFVISLIEFLYIATLGGLGTAYAQAVASGYEGDLKHIVRTRLTYGLSGVVLAVVLGAFFIIRGDTTIGMALIGFSVFIPLIPTSQLYINYLSAKSLFGFQSWALVGVRSLTALLLTVTIILYPNNLYLILFIFFSSTLVAHAFFFALTIKSHPINEKRKDGVIRYGSHLSFMDAFGTASQYLDRLLLGSFMGPVALATYVVAITIPQEIVARSFGILVYLIFPGFAKGNTSPKKVFLVCCLLALCTIPVIVAYILIAPIVFTLFFPQYTDAIIYTQILSGILFFVPFGILIHTYFTATSQVKKLYLTSFVDTIFKLASFTILIWYFGILGAVYATLLTAALRSILYVFFLFSKTNMLGTKRAL